MARVFVSYRREKSDQVDWLVEDMQNLGHDVFIDRHHQGNQEWWHKILSSIAESDVIIPVYDQLYDNSYPCCRELDYAVDLGLQIIPVYVDGEVPGGFTPRHSHAFNYVEFANDKPSYVRLQNRLNDVSTGSRKKSDKNIPPDFPANELIDVFEEHIVNRADQTERDQIVSLSQIENLIRNDHPTNEIVFLLEEHRRRGPQQSYRERVPHQKYEELKERLGKESSQTTERETAKEQPGANNSKRSSKRTMRSPYLRWVGIAIGVLLVGVVFSDKILDYTTQLADRERNGKDPVAGKPIVENSKIAPGLEMVPIPEGTFMMGSTEQEFRRDSDEAPQREVAIRAFELSNTEVTFDQYAIFAGDTKRELLDDKGWGRGGRPVINVTWDDAIAYTTWLNEKTASNYRLPTEAEWEYAARAGTTSPFYSGDCINTKQANYNGKYDYDNCGAKTGKFLEQTSTVKSYEPNDWGLYDMAGNVWEWTQDCSHNDYTNAPSDGSAWLDDDSGDCRRRVMRGGSWSSLPHELRSAFRFRDNRNFSSSFVGFRVARTP